MQRSLIFSLRHKGISNAKRQGFTLVELVTVIIILGILVLGVSSFLIFGTRIFIDSTSVEQVMSQSRFAIERMTRDIRNAVPNSIRVANGASGASAWQCIEMMPITSSSSYILAPIAPLPASNTATVMQGSGAPLVKVDDVTLSLLIYPLSPADVYTSVTSTSGKLFKIDEVTDDSVTNVTTIKFTKSVQFSAMSPRQRYFGVSDAISYCFEGITSELSVLKRYSGYNFNHPNTQPSPTEMGTSVLMAENVVNTIRVNSPMVYTPGTLQNNAMVQLNPLFDIQGQSLQYHHQVQVINVP
ncbi:MSHA biogenesis protein MshO [Shewanella sp. Choline-02u-19]|uniref:PilW family protein n=1 Tax=unclassified Shewanella TaxID=196818 RepID=UPI000C334522|nr:MULTISPECIES: type II secretion system protein [unclassified Shewanella]PKH58836.1 MSHA biogenesis protein MshO [Shewanella sp. Bg11-22]PKI29017.1 MSHA biogenesis protein MshO [Shewanella sp. Choline-02u-19]